jgi:hypothetical protein
MSMYDPMVDVDHGVGRRRLPYSYSYIYLLTLLTLLTSTSTSTSFGRFYSYVERRGRPQWGRFQHSPPAFIVKYQLYNAFKTNLLLTFNRKKETNSIAKEGSYY